MRGIFCVCMFRGQAIEIKILAFKKYHSFHSINIPSCELHVLHCCCYSITRENYIPRILATGIALYICGFVRVCSLAVAIQRACC